MNFDLYTKIINDIKMFPNKIKCIHLTSRGEPLLNKNLPEMISYAKKQNVAERLNLVTNGLLLSPELNIKIIDAGITSVKISIQSTSEEEYKRISNIKINLQNFVNNIKHLYENKKNCKIYIKIGDNAIKNDNDKQNFHNMFHNICNGINIEHIYNLDNNFNVDTNLLCYASKKADVCPRPFYSLNIGFDGNVLPCCYYKMPGVGNLHYDNIIEVWNGNNINKLRSLLLRNSKLLCGNCNVPIYDIEEEDNIDSISNKLIDYYK